jgi:tetratricopeptide (TPR) repeat protein
MDPDEAESHALRASILFGQGKTAAALEATRQGLQVDPDNESCRFWKGLLLGKEGRHGEADDEIEALLADDPDSADNHAARGSTLHLRGDDGGAERHFIEALRISPGHEDARVGLIETLKRSHPLTGFLLRFLVRLGEIRWYYYVIGFLVLWRLGRLAKSSGHVLLEHGGTVLSALLFGLILLSLAVTPAFNLTLITSRKARLALSPDEKRALKWSFLPLVLTSVFFVSWVSNGARTYPAHALAWCAVAALACEVFETARSGARRGLTVVAIAAAIVAVYLLVIGNVYLARVVAAIREAGGAEELQARLEVIMREKRRLMDYPVFAIFLLASFRDNVREVFERRAGD